jgi:uncharacterized SAM-binding protein YcdF (DUF218 family)
MRIVAPLLGLALLAITGWLVLTLMGTFLVTENPLEPAAAIIVLDGGVPLREQEGARLYAEGWASRVVITRGVGMPDGSLSRVDVLESLGVPPGVISVSDRFATNTQDELAILADAIQPGTSPVLLVTSPYHTRRTAIAWSLATNGRSRGITRGAQQDPFDRQAWWREPPMRTRIWHEYVGLAAYAIGLRDN